MITVQQMWEEFIVRVADTQETRRMYDAKRTEVLASGEECRAAMRAVETAFGLRSRRAPIPPTGEGAQGEEGTP